MGKAIRESSIGTRLGKSSKLRMFFFIKREKMTILVCVDEIKPAGKKQNIDPMWKVLMKYLDVGKPTSFLDHVSLGRTQRKCQTSKDIVDTYRIQISAGATEKLPCSQKLGANISSWSYDVEGHAKKCVERYCELANKTTQHLYIYIYIYI